MEVCTSLSTSFTAPVSTSGPAVTPVSMPLPTTRSRVARTNFSTNSSYTASCTKIRLAQTQVWPELRYFETIAPSTAASISASSNTMNGALPPSSMDTFFTVPAHCSISFFPTGVEPVKVSLRTIGLPVSSPPISPDEPQITLITPEGMPARSARSAIAKADSGVDVAGLITMVQPAASAGAAFRAIMALGKFHGVIAATTPTGCLMQTMRLSADGPGMTSPSMRLASSPNHSTKDAP